MFVAVRGASVFGICQNCTIFAKNGPIPRQDCVFFYIERKCAVLWQFKIRLQGVGFSVDVILDTFLRSIRWVLLRFFFCQTEFLLRIYGEIFGFSYWLAAAAKHKVLPVLIRVLQDSRPTWGLEIDKGVRQTGRGLIINIKPYLNSLVQTLHSQLYKKCITYVNMR